jgi:hypothetical protein
MEKLRKVPPHGFSGDRQLIEELARSDFNGDIAAARASWEAERKNEQIWINEKYQVATIVSDDPTFGKIMQINIRRRDGNVIMRDWREFQDIKNQLAGPECEGLELYPAESRLIDVNNKYHIWVILNPEHQIPIGWFQGRHVRYEPTKSPGLRQRPLPKHWKGER